MGMTQVVGACSLFLAAAGTSAQTPVGQEFRVNTYTTGPQVWARPAMEPDGDFVVVWSRLGQDGSNYGVFGQRFAASGAPRGSEFDVSNNESGEGRPAVAVGSSGDFVVVWESANIPYGIQGRRFDASGSAIGTQFFVDMLFFDVAREPRVGRAADGRFVVSWTRSYHLSDNRDIVGRRFDASGNPIGDEFIVNTYTTYDQVASDLAVDADGNFVVVWTDLSGRDGSSHGIVGQRFDASATPLGGEFQVNTYTTGNQGRPSVSVSPAGGFVVAWSGLGDGDDDGGVSARRFNASGTAVGNDFLVNTYTSGPQYGMFGQVAHDALGNFVVAWNGPGDGSDSASFTQRFSASGARRGAEFRVNTYTTGNQGLPSVASDAIGNFVVVWHSAGQDGSEEGVFAQLFDGDLIFEDGFDSGAMSP